MGKHFAKPGWLTGQFHETMETDKMTIKVNLLLSHLRRDIDAILPVDEHVVFPISGGVKMFELLVGQLEGYLVVQIRCCVQPSMTICCLVEPILKTRVIVKCEHGQSLLRTSLHSQKVESDAGGRADDLHYRSTAKSEIDQAN